MKTLAELNNKALDLTEKLSFAIEVVTPEKAAMYLGTSIGNRNIKKDTMSALIDALSKGTFEVNGETIVFDQDGSLMDGHHRMEAIVRSKVPAICLIVRGIERNTWTTMDSGTARSLGDVFKFEGIPNYNSVSSIVAGTYAMSKGKIGINTLGSGNKLKRDCLSRKDALELYHKYANIWQEAARIGINTRYKLSGLFSIKEVGVISAHLVIYLHHSLEKVEEFWDLVINGDGIYASLRNLFLKDMQETRFKKMSAQSRQSCIASVWNKYLADKKAKRVQYSFTEIVMFK